jgi:hypothetical protein
MNFLYDIPVFLRIMESEGAICGRKERISVKRSFRLLTFAFIAGLLAVFALPLSPAGAAASTDNDADAYLEHIMWLAREKKTLNSGPFQVVSLLDEVKKWWGEPDDDSGVAANYWDRNIRFIYDPDKKGNPVTWIEDFDPALQKITLEELLDTLGEADWFVEAEGDYYVTYLLNNGHEITFVLNVPMEGQTSKVYLYYVTEHTP